MPRMRYRRPWLCAPIAAAALVSLFAPLPAAAQDYPVKPVRVIVGLAPGGATDIQARLFAQKMSQNLKRPFVVENRTGAGSLIAFAQVAKAPPDGYTLLVITPAFTLAPSLQAKLAFDPVRDFTPVSLVTRAPYVLLVHPSLPARSLKEFIALARARPGALDFATSGHGTTIHFAQLWLENAARIKLVSVPYKGTAPAVADVLAGQVHATFGNVLSIQPHLKSGRLRALAVTSAARAAVLREVPTFAESGLAGYDVTTWHAWMAPAGTPAAIINLVREELVQAVRSPDVAERLTEDGGEIVGSTPAELARHLADETARWRRIAQETGVRLE
jgi:tripartite-type tricarboxylate transporter receptor subunit TctC